MDGWVIMADAFSPAIYHLPTSTIGTRELVFQELKYAQIEESRTYIIDVCLTLYIMFIH